MLVVVVSCVMRLTEEAQPVERLESKTLVVDTLVELVDGSEIEVMLGALVLVELLAGTRAKLLLVAESLDVSVLGNGVLAVLE